MNKVLAIASAALLALGMFLGTAGTALAWSPPGITPLCSDVEGQYNWTVTLSGDDRGPDWQASNVPASLREWRGCRGGWSRTGATWW